MTVDDIKKLRLQRAALQLSNDMNGDGSPVVVSVYIDDANSRAYQLDERNQRYRVADSSTGERYGAWVSF